MAKDLAKIVEQILLQDILSPKTTTVHRSFSRLKKIVIKNLEELKIKEWLVERVSYELQQYLSMIESPLNMSCYSLLSSLNDNPAHQK